MTVVPIGAAGVSAPALLTLDQLDAEEAGTLSLLERQLSGFRISNLVHELYYEANTRIRNSIQVPPEVAARLETVCGWPGTAVDVLEERLDWEGWVPLDGSEDDYDLGQIYSDNNLDTDSGMGHLDALIYGSSFVRVGPSDVTPSGVAITTHSPTTTTGLWDFRTRRLSAAMTYTQFNNSDGMASEVVVDLPGLAIVAERSHSGAKWTVIDRITYDSDRVMVAQLVNRPRGSRFWGRSEITRPVRYLADAGARTTLGMESNREFYSIPQLMLLGRGKEAFKDKNGNIVSGWQVIAGHALAIGKDADGDIPTIQQLQVGSPQAFTSVSSELAHQLAAESGFPVSYLGVQSDNPSSADAIRALEIRLVKRAERRQAGFTSAWREVAHLTMDVRGERVPDDFRRRIGLVWRNAATPTQAAAADEAAKLVAAGVLPKHHPITWKRVGLSPNEIAQLQQYHRDNPEPTPSTVPPPSLVPPVASDEVPGTSAQVDTQQPSETPSVASE